MAKIIRSHRERVKAANHMLKNNEKYKDERISIFDREAFVEFYLLEDIERLYRRRLKEEKEHVSQGQADESEGAANNEKFKAIINLLDAAVLGCRTAIELGNYKTVWKAIPERALTVAANSVKRLPVLREILCDMLRDLYKDLTSALIVNRDFDEDLELHDINDMNVREYYHLPIQEAIDEIIRYAEEVIPDKKGKSRSNPDR